MATSMVESENAETPQLSELFEDGRVLHTQLEDSTEPSNSKSFQEKVQRAIGHLEQATVMVSQLDLFSRNEELEECPTAHLRYLLLPALLGDLTLRLMGEERLEVVERSKAYFRDYFKRCRDYGVTKEEIPEDPSPECTSLQGPPRGGGKPDLAAMQSNRDAKIRKYKEAKELESKLAGFGTWDVISNRDDEAQREFYVLVLKKWVQTALEQLDSIQQEMEILQHMAKMKKASGAPGSDVSVNQPLPQPQRKPLKPFILTKDALQAQVFGAGYPSIPTMTLDEYYQKEVREGKIQLDSGQNQPRKSDQEEIEEIELRKEIEVETDDPVALKKAREWDDWKDDHKRGWGNRDNRS